MEGKNIVDFSLQENKEMLNEITVEERKKSYNINKPSVSLRLNELTLEVPQNIQIVGEHTFKDQQIISMSDGLIRNVSGAVRLEHWADMYTNINMRCSQIKAFRNGFNAVNSYWGPLTEDISYIDRIEFVKGPAGFMLSNGYPSGLYNVVTKKPTGSNKGEAEITAGSFNLYRVEFDLDRRLTDNGKLLFRLNATAQNKGSFRPNEQNNRYSFAPTLSYQITNSAKVTVAYAYQKALLTEVRSYCVFGNKYAEMPYNFTLAQPGFPKTNINDHSLFLNLQQFLGADWKITAQGGYFKYLQKGYSSWPGSVRTDGKIIRNVSIWDAKSAMNLARLFVNGEVKTKGIHHRILIGFDGGKKKYFANRMQSHDLATQPFDVCRPNYDIALNRLPNFDQTSPIEIRARASVSIMGQNYLSVYAQNELGFFKNKIRLTLAGRYTSVVQFDSIVSNSTAKKITPRLALSISSDKNSAVYALYDQGFVPQFGFFRDGSAVKPTTGNNTEIGIKKDWADGRWNITLSVYRILKQNEITENPNNKPSEIFSLVIDEKKAEGVEFDVRGELLKNLMITANYAYTNAEVTKVAKGVKTLEVGDAVPGYAKHVANIWLSYRMVNGPVKGFGINAGVTYLGNRATDTWSKDLEKLPNYAKFDAGLSYQKNKIKITGKVFNLLNKYIYSGSYYQPLQTYYWQAEAPINFRLNVTYKF